MLTNKDKSTLKQIIHSDMKKIVNFNIGKESLNENNIKMLKNAFNTHEIIKISFLKSCLEQENKQQLILDLSSELQAEVVQSIGHTVILYKENKELENHIKL
ncbi:MAG: YhbY family RNA-binding protein [Candidatus Onthovivens sp.]|nr:YhbY family RNA-binding protein [Mollicutes bacterium]MDD6468880.1 YhbY family RNA-binding protein [Bacilli bacterium]MDY2725054.1 YhbY family RNA-binding protein [Candidatus Onthovivens sp.]MCI6615183.1 YhbY family RNA-binding protein [Mollicutes bacterium]MCI7039417.1 YhbY family RNA-binding protein [Mollicutes bacterium]